MTDQERPEQVDQQIKAIDSWIYTFRVQLKPNEEGLTIPHVDIPEIDTMLLRSVLEGCGAEFNPEKEGYDKLRQPTNRFRRSGMNTVWGEEFMDRYNKWTNLWARAYESTDRRLPKLEKSGTRTSGMRHFLGMITAYAAQEITFDQFKKQMEVRIVNGFTFARGLGKTPTDILPEGKRFPSSIPPLFPTSAWEVVKSKELFEKVPDMILSPELSETS